MKKLFATLLALAMLIAGVCYLTPEANEVKAATTSEKNYTVVAKNSEEYTMVEGVPTKAGYVFGGYYKLDSAEDECTIPKRCRAKDANYVKFVEDSVLDVKVQVTNGVVQNTENEKYKGKYVIRFISSVDGLNYRNIGFELTYKDGNETKTIRHTTTNVFKSIDSTVGTVDGKADTYEFSPNLLSTDSEYFMTVKLPVAQADAGKVYTIRAFWTTLDGTEVFGNSRSVSVNDSKDNIVNLSANVALDENTAYVATYTSASGAEKTGTVTVLPSNAVRVALAEGDTATNLKSVTKFTISVKDGDKVDEVLYRNYYSSHEVEGDSTTPVADTSWYEMYPDATEYTIASSADLYGLAKLVNDGTDTFAGKTVSVVKNITVNKGIVKRYRDTGNAPAWVADSAEKTYPWTPIGTAWGTWFNGTFDGHGHEISGIYLNATAGKNGFFGYTGNASVLKNFKFVNSYIKATVANVGLIGASYTLQYENIYNDASIHYTAGYAGGFVGYLGAVSGKQQVFNNCWFDGELYHGGSTYTSAFVGMIGEASNIKMTNCLMTGDVVGVSGGVHTGNHYGTLLGFANKAGTKVEIANCMVAGYVNFSGTVGKGALVGNQNNSTGSMTNVYLVSEPTTITTLQGSTNAGITLNNVERVESSSLSNLNQEELLAKFPVLDGEEQTAWVCDEGTPILRTFASWYKGREKAIVPNTSWYTAASASKKYEITTAAELYGLAELSQTKDFTGWEITLGKDIELNKIEEGTVESWKNGAVPVNTWTPIGTSGTTMPFKGSFDGKGYTISGLYLNTATGNSGLFARTNGAVIKDFKLVDSYMRTTNNNLGLIGYVAGDLTLENVYSDAVVVVSGSGTKTSGKLFGRIEGGGTVSIEGCWSDGELIIDGGGNYVAGFIGYFNMAAGGNFTLRNCLNSADIVSTTGDANYLGGYIGSTGNTAVTITMTDCLDVGSVKKVGSTISQVGSFIGFNNESSATWNGVVKGDKDAECRVYSIGNAYANNSAVNKTIGNVGSTGYTQKQFLTTRTELLATTEEQLETLFGEGQTAWECDSVSNNTDRGTPILSHINKDNWWTNRQTVTEYKIQADISWYEEASAKKEYTIKTAAELYGFAQLSQTKDFTSWEITLGADIELNYVGDGTVEAWKNGAEPVNTWTPIGTSGTTMPFKGSFDGKGYTISGLYLNTATGNSGLFARTNGAVIKDFKLVDSYMRTTNNNLGLIGYVAGDLTLANVYSDAVVVVSGSGTKTSGKLFGRIEGSGTVSIEGCWSDGEIIIDASGNYVAGFIGYFNKSSGSITLQNCLNSTDIVSTTGNSNYLGGFIGSTGNTAVTITMTDCLDVGSIRKVGTEIGCVGSFIGFNNTSKATWSGVARVYSIGNAYYDNKPVGKTIGLSNTSYTTTQFLTSRSTLLATTETQLNTLFGSNQTAWECDSVINNTNRGTPILSHFNKDNWWANRQNDVNLTITPDTSWYDTRADKFLLTTAEQLYGLAELSQRYNFEGQEIKLGADIALNYVGEDTVAAWKNGEVAIKTWTPIGTTGTAVPFKGTFDGQGHTISGLYMNTSTRYNGMFARVNGATIQNFKLVDSYMRTTSREFGLVGYVENNLTLQNVYSDAVLVVSGTGTKTTGKLVGYIAGNGTTTVEGCWSDGEIIIDGGGNYVGGIIGYFDMGAGGNFTLQNCLNSADIVSTTGDSDYLGGFIGSTGNAAVTITMTDCLDVGSIRKVGSKITQVGSFMGFNNESSATWNGVVAGDKDADIRVYTIGNAYYNNDVLVEKTIANPGKTNYTTTQFLTFRSDLLATTEEELEALFGEGQTAWVCDTAIDGEKRGTPILATFADWWIERAPEVVEGYIAPDISWYEEAEANGTYEIETAGEMYGFALLSKTYDFDDIEITLGNDIELNIVEDGTVAAWEKGTQAVNNWTPIGSSKTFKGTFDGKGNTISGLYANSDIGPMGLFSVTAVGSEVKNFRIVDSYLKSTNTAELPAGSAVGRLGGDMSNVYSNAVIYRDYSRTGGLVGEVLCRDSSAPIGDGSLPILIENCWFDGKIVGGATDTARRVGGIVGKLHYGKLTMNNVLFTGTIDSDVTHARAYIGGLVGVTQETFNGLELHINSAISAGKITGEFKNSEYVGSIVGSLLGSYESVVGAEGLPKYSFTNVFATRDCYNIPYAEYVYKSGNESAVSVIEGTVVMSSGDDRLLGYIPQGINGAHFNESVKEKPILGSEVTISSPYTGLVPKVISKLDFTSNDGWTVRTEGVPVLKCFADLVEIVEPGETDLTTKLTTEVGLDVVNAKITDAVAKGAGNYVVTYDLDQNDTTTYDNYCAQLKALGFGEPFVTNEGTTMADDGVYSATFVKKATEASGEWVINVTYVDNVVEERRGYYSYTVGMRDWSGDSSNIETVTNKKRLYVSISTDTSSVSNNLKEENVTKSGNQTVTLAMLEDTTGRATDGSNAFVFQLPNGHFIINDGAYDAATLIAYLRNLTPYEDKKVVIDAWTITHFHDDHIAAIAKLMDDPTLRDKVYVEAVYVSEPSTYGMNSWTSYDAYNYSNKVMKAFGMMSTQKGEEVPVYQVHMGQRYYFNGVTMDVVDTQEQHLEEYWNTYTTNSSLSLPDPSNTASTQFIFTVTDTGKRVLLGGDATLVNMEYMMQAYGENPNTFANINVYAAYHHGKNMTFIYNNGKECTPTWYDYMLNNTSNTEGVNHTFDVVLFARHTLFVPAENGAYALNTAVINEYLIGRSKEYYTWSYGDCTGATSDSKHGSVKLELGETVTATVY